MEATYTTFVIFRTVVCEKKAYHIIWLQDISDDQISSADERQFL